MLLVKIHVLEGQYDEARQGVECGSERARQCIRHPA